MKSISGLVCYVKDTAKTAEFYKKLGFTFEKNEPDHISIRLNWFWIDFHPQDKESKPEFKHEATMKEKGGGIFINIKVENVDEFYKGTVKKALSQVASRATGRGTTANLCCATLTATN